MNDFGFVLKNDFAFILHILFVPVKLKLIYFLIGSCIAAHGELKGEDNI
jgi:hypothetical protein